MRTLRVVGMAVVAILLCLNWTACSSDDNNENEVTLPIVGQWYEKVVSEHNIQHETTLTFKADGTGSVKGVHTDLEDGEVSKPEPDGFKYTVNGADLMVVWDDYANDVDKYTFAITGKALMIVGSDLAGTYTKQ